MKIINIENYEIGNGINVTIEKDGDTYNTYLQLPETGDSKHSFLDGNNNDELLNDIAIFVSGKYTDTQLSILTNLGTLDFYHEENNGYHVAVDKADTDNYVFLKESSYNSYYNVFMLVQIDREDCFYNKSLEDELMEILNNIQKTAK